MPIRKKRSSPAKEKSARTKPLIHKSVTREKAEPQGSAFHYALPPNRRTTYAAFTNIHTTNRNWWLELFVEGDFSLDRNLVGGHAALEEVG